MLSGHAPGSGERLYTYDLETGALSPISPEGITAYFSAMASPRLR